MSKPLLYVGPFSHRIYLALAYKELPGGTIEVTGKKYDVTNQVGGVLEELDRMGLELTPKATTSSDVIQDVAPKERS